MIPFIIRSFIALFDKTGTVEYWINETDFIILGLVLNLTNINELEDKDFEDKIWKTRKIGYSVVSIAVFSSILAIVTYSDFKQNQDLDKTMVKGCSIALSFVSFIFSYSIFNRLNTIEK